MFWQRKREKSKKQVVAAPPESKKKRKVRGPSVAMEVKLAAVDALASGLNASEVAELIGVSDTTVLKWRRIFDKGGIDAFRRSPSTVAVRKRCKVLEERIVSRRQEHPDRGVRRIRDDLRREEGLETSAETVRTVVNEAGLGNTPVQAGRRPPQVRRFERAVPNALWQIDIFTFQLKRMYPVYLIGIIDDHSRYIVGQGLFRRQTGDAVMEVVKGAIGQWGAPREILSDNGRQFVSWRGKSRFQKELKRQGIGHVRSAPHHPMTLGKIERFWKTIWGEFLEEAVFASFADATQRLDHWIQFYNHQRPHQGIDGASPADRFYGLAADVEEAVRQGCQDNSLRIALGQEPQPPLFLLGQLGGTDLRVTRKGEDIEVRIGDSVREVIRLGIPYRIDENGTGGRGDDDDVEGPERGRAVPGGGDGDDGAGNGEGAEPELQGVPEDLVQGDRGGAGGGCHRPGAEEARAQADSNPRSSGDRVQEREGGHNPGAGALEDQVRDRQDLPGSATSGFVGYPGLFADPGPGPDAGKKKEDPAPADPASAHPRTHSGVSWYDWDESEDGGEGW
jgi:transposase InsO family protein